MEDEMVAIPTIEVYGHYANPNYGINSQVLTIGNLKLYYSFKTVVAYEDSDGLVVTRNIWGGNTGKHLRWIDGGSPDARARRIPYETFKIKLAQAIAQQIVTEAE